MTVAVVGAGPVGQTLAARLISGGNDVSLVEISAQVRSRIARDGITLTGAHELRVPAPSLCASLDELAGRTLDVVFVAVKATATELVASAISDVCDSGATVVSWQNGIDTERMLVPIEPQRIVRAAINHGVLVESSGAVRVAFEHPPHLVREYHPEGRERAIAVARVLTDSALPTERAEELEQAVWMKAALNSALNAICALTGLTLHEAWHDSYAGELARSVLKETIQVARANEILLGKGFYRYCLDYLAAVGAHKPSMLLDREAGRRTEIDFINGKVVEYGRIAGIQTPHNVGLVALVKAAERATRTNARSPDKESQ